MLANICKNYPRMMRKRGWDFDDLDITDWEKYQSDLDYRAERKVKWKNNGNSVNEYIKKKTKKQLEENIETAQKLAEEQRDIQLMKSILYKRDEKVLQSKNEADNEFRKWHNSLLELDKKLVSQEKNEKAFQVKKDNFDSEVEQKAIEMIANISKCPSDVPEAVLSAFSSTVDKRVDDETKTLKSNVETLMTRMDKAYNDYHELRLTLSRKEQEKTLRRHLELEEEYCDIFQDYKDDFGIGY